MDSESHPANIESFVAHCQGVAADRLQSLVFLAQAFGEEFGYSYEAHHLRVFSRSLERDIEALGNQTSFRTGHVSELCAFMANHLREQPLEHLEYAAAYLYFEQKGYSATDIEKSLNGSDEVEKGAKKVLSNLRSAGIKSLAKSGAR